MWTQTQALHKLQFARPVTGYQHLLVGGGGSGGVSVNGNGFGMGGGGAGAACYNAHATLPAFTATYFVGRGGLSRSGAQTFIEGRSGTASTAALYNDLYSCSGGGAGGSTGDGGNSLHGSGGGGMQAFNRGETSVQLNWTLANTLYYSGFAGG